MRIRPLALALALLAAALLSPAGAEPLQEAPALLSPAALGVGDRLPDFAFTDLAGRSAKLSDLASFKAVAVCVTSTTCPISRKYGPTLAELEQAYRARNVAFLAVNVSAAEPVEKMTAQAADLAKLGFAGRYVPDRQQAIGKLLAARSTTEVFVLDRARTLVYRGAIDDQFGLGYALDAPRHHYLARALDAALADDRPAVGATTAPGCALSLGERPQTASALTYHDRVARIVQANCAECHRAGENAPFELGTFADVKDHAAMIRKVVTQRTMPPWFADPAKSHAFATDRSLADRDRDDIVKWVDAGCPEGDKADAPVPRQFATGWRIGKPDAVFEAAAQKIPAKGTVKYRYATAQTNLTEDKWVTAIEIRASAPEVVHHVLVFLAPPGGEPRQALRATGGGLNGYFAGMVPGQGAITFAEGTAKLLPKGTSIVFQIHYTTNGTEVTDHPRIGFKFAAGPPKYELQTKAASNPMFAIPPGAPNHPVTAVYTLRNKSRLVSVNPHSHVRGKAFRYELVYPDGRTEVILDVPRYDFNWQMEYVFAKPIDVPAGTRVRVTGWFDNSKDNPANPDPTKTVRFGEQTWEEMMIGYVTGHVLE